MDDFLKMPHFRQSDYLRNCGAACLAMVYKKYNKKGKIKDITEDISFSLPNGLPSCRNALLIKHAINTGFNCSAISAKDIKTFIPLCMQHGVDSIVSYHPVAGDPGGHFSVVTGINDEFIFVNDPAKDAPLGLNFPIRIDDLASRMIAGEKSPEIVVDNTIIILAPKKLNLPIRTVEHNLDGDTYSIDLFEFSLSEISAFVDPVMDCWIRITTSPAGS